MAAVLIFATLLLVQISVSTQHSLLPRLLYGEDASRNQFAFVASIQMNLLSWLPYIHTCAATVLDEYWLLSTAACVNIMWRNNRAKIKINMYFTFGPDERIQTFNVVYKVTHENTTGSGNLWINDIGLIKLDGAISNPRFAKLPQPGDTASGQVFMVGWGYINNYGRPPTVLQYALVNILENQRCQRLLSGTSLNTTLQDSQLCIASPGQSITGCNGDAGGPVFRYVNGDPEIVGIISSTIFPCGIKNAPTIITRVSHFIEWINEKKAIASQMASDTDNL